MRSRRGRLLECALAFSPCHDIVFMDVLDSVQYWTRIRGVDDYRHARRLSRGQSTCIKYLAGRAHGFDEKVCALA